MKPIRVNTLIQSMECYPYLDNRKSPRGLTKQQYKRIIKLFLTKLANTLITTGSAVFIPSMLGSFKVMSWKKSNVVNRKIVNFEETNRLRRETGDDKIISYDINFNSTEGYQPVLRWGKRGRRASKVTETNISGYLTHATFKHCHNYSAQFTRTVMRRNLDHTKHAEVNLTTYFKSEGYFKYDKIN